MTLPTVILLASAKILDKSLLYLVANVLITRNITDQKKITFANIVDILLKNAKSHDDDRTASINYLIFSGLGITVSCSPLRTYLRQN